MLLPVISSRTAASLAPLRVQLPVLAFSDHRSLLRQQPPTKHQNQEGTGTFLLERLSYRTVPLRELQIVLL